MLASNVVEFSSSLSSIPFFALAETRSKLRRRLSEREISQTRATRSQLARPSFDWRKTMETATTETELDARPPRQKVKVN